MKNINTRYARDICPTRYSLVRRAQWTVSRVRINLLSGY